MTILLPAITNPQHFSKVAPDSADFKLEEFFNCDFLWKTRNLPAAICRLTAATAILARSRAVRTGAIWFLQEMGIGLREVSGRSAAADSDLVNLNRIFHGGAIGQLLSIDGNLFAAG